MSMEKTTILDIQNLSVSFQTQRGLYRAVNDLSLNVAAGKTLAIVGESGCGKSVTSLAIMSLLPDVAQISSGSVFLGSKDLLKCSSSEMCSIRGNEIGMIFQEPLTALNPVYTIGQQIREVILLHKKISKTEAKELTLSLLEKVRIPDPEKRFDEYPFQLSGGMKQRVLIAMALACQPKVLIADEPTTALDVTIQAQIIELIKELQEEMKMGVIFITHDLGVVAEVADDVVIMYAGEVIEKGTVYQIFDTPRHPYTRGLLDSMPTLHTRRDLKLKTIKGSVPSLFNRSEGCHFSNRCSYRKDSCDNQRPILEKNNATHEVACHYYKDL